MAHRRFTVLTDRAYDTPRGETVTLDPADPLVQANITAGVIELATEHEDAATPPDELRCPACSEAGMKRPPKLASQKDVDTHYDEKHPALAKPVFQEV